MNFCKTTGCTFAACALATALGACGGFGDEDAAAYPVAALAPPLAPPTLPPLLDDAGQPNAPLAQAVPRRGDEMTRAGLYALRAQAKALQQALGGDAVWLGEACCRAGKDAADAELALGTVAGLMAAHDLNANAPVFVDLLDRRQAAALADRLAAAGYTRVFLITD